MSEEGLKLEVYCGERDRAGGRFLADRLLDIFEAHGLRAGALLRGVEGFGLKHQRRTDRLLTLSEDLPVVAVGVDRRDRIEAAAAAVGAVDFEGLITLERARLIDASDPVAGEPGPGPELSKLTLYVGRGRRLDGRLAYQVAVDVMRDHGLEGASVLLGVDGTVHGGRRRARLLAANAEVPAVVVGVGAPARVAAALPDLHRRLEDPVTTLERVRVLKRDGRLPAAPGAVPERDPEGLRLWQKLTLYSSEGARVAGRPVHVEAVGRLRAAGAAGATSLRAVWGYDGRNQPHGDSFWSLRRHVPTVTTVVDEPSRAARWFEVLDEITPERGLITSEVVPAARAGSGRAELRLAAPGWWLSG